MNRTTQDQEILSKLKQQAFVPVIRVKSIKLARKAIEWLATDGVSVVELTLTIPGLMDELKNICADPALTVGVGTVRDFATAKEAVRAGGRFIVTPFPVEGFEKADFPFFMGALTPGEVNWTLAQKPTGVKIFPASLGGPSHIKAMKAIFPGTLFFPTGGIHQDNFTEYLKAGASVVGMGDRLLNDELLESGNRQDLTARINKIRSALSSPNS